MAKQKKIAVPEEFILALKEKLVIDKTSLPTEMREKSWQNQLREQLNSFIHNELKDRQYDKDLYQQVYHRSSGDYPSLRTISRAFITEKTATVTLIHLCGWYAFKEEWINQRAQFQFEEVLAESKEQSKTLQATRLKAGKDLSIKVEQSETKTKIDDLEAGGNIHIDIKAD